MSSTYLYQQVGLRVAWFSALSSKSSIKKLAMNGDSGELTIALRNQKLHVLCSVVT
jgi:hypothetical protein